MKRSIFIVSVILLISAGIFSACKENEEDIRKIYSTKEGRFDLNENEFVTMWILPEEGTNNSSHILRIENHTEKVLQYGREFSLEYLNKNNWKSISLHDVQWELIVIGLNSDETTEEMIYFFPLIEKYNNNKNGQYRLTKIFSLIDFPLGDVVVSGIKLSTEFEIK